MLWAKVAYLKHGEKPPGGEQAVILDCHEPGTRRPRYDKGHIVHRMDDLNQVIPLIEKLARNGVTKIYLAGFEEDADHPAPAYTMPERYGTA